MGMKQYSGWARTYQQLIGALQHQNGVGFFGVHCISSGEEPLHISHIEARSHTVLHSCNNLHRVHHVHAAPYSKLQCHCQACFQKAWSL
jgi:hypothetical protein